MDLLIQAIQLSNWFKVRCAICPKEIFQLCPPKRNLEANLFNHVQGVVHAKTLEDLNAKSAQRSPLSTGKRGKPSRSSASNGEASQKGLHSFFRHVEGELQSYDRESLYLLACWVMRGLNCVYVGKSYGINWKVGLSGSTDPFTRRMYDLFALNYDGLNSNTTERENQKVCNLFPGNMWIFFKAWPRSTKMLRLLMELLALYQ